MKETKTEDTSITITFPDKSELDIGEDGYPLPPEGIKVMKNGGGYSTELKHIVYGPGTFALDPNAFDTDKAHDAHLAKIAKAEDELIRAIEERTGKPFDEIFAEGGATLFTEIVLGRSKTKHGGRERFDVWEGIGKRAGVVPDKAKTEAQARAGIAGMSDLQAIIPVELLREARKILELRATLQDQGSALEADEIHMPLDHTDPQPESPVVGHSQHDEGPHEQVHEPEFLVEPGDERQVQRELPDEKA